MPVSTIRMCDIEIYRIAHIAIYKNLNPVAICQFPTSWPPYKDGRKWELFNNNIGITTPRSSCVHLLHASDSFKDSGCLKS